MLIPSAISLLKKHRKILPPTGSIADLGDQLLYSREHAAQAFPEISNQILDEDIDSFKCVSLIYQNMGLCNRICIDYSENADIRINLNYSALSLPEIEAKFDMVTNHGFSEHVFNQMSVFECMHYICKSGGIMFHTVPCQGWADGNGWGHGFYQYQPNFFRNLASSNNYKIIDLQISPFTQSGTLHTFDSKLYPIFANPHLLKEEAREKLEINKGQFVSILAIMKKSADQRRFLCPHE